MADWEQGLSALAAQMPRCDAERQGAELYGAPRFSVFDLLDDREPALSRVLADLFDSRGSHGQGVLFLNDLLPMLGLRPVRRDTSTIVRVEAPVTVEGRPNNRRLDILIETAHLVIGIENKIWTSESEDQLAHYLAHLERTAAGRAVRLVFVSAQKPSILHDAVTQLPYLDSEGDRSVATLLHGVRPRIKAARIADFVDDLARWITRKFGSAVSTNGMEAHMEAVFEALKDHRQSEAVGAIILARSELHRHVIDGVEARLRDALLANFPDFEFCGYSLFECLSHRWDSWHARRPFWPENCFLALEADDRGFRAIGYGVQALDPESQEAKKEEHVRSVCTSAKRLGVAISSVSTESTPSPWWRWDRFARVSDWSLDSVGRGLVENGDRLHNYLGVDQIESDFISLAGAISDEFSDKSE